MRRRVSGLRTATSAAKETSPLVSVLPMAFLLAAGAMQVTSPSYRSSPVASDWMVAAVPTVTVVMS